MNTHTYNTSHRTTVLTIRESDPVADAAAAQAIADAAIQARIDAAVEAATTGLKNKNTELIGKIKSGADKLKEFEGLDAVKIKEIQARLDNDDDIKAFSEGRKNEVINKYTDRMRADHITQLQAAEDRVKEQSDRADAYKGSVLDNQIRAVTGGLHKGAVEDALLHARNIFSLDAKGNAVQLDSEGRPVLGKDGSTSFSPAEWVELQKELKPHWFPMGSTGSGSGGVRDSSGTGKTIKRADFDKLSSADQRTQAIGGIKIID